MLRAENFKLLCAECFEIWVLNLLATSGPVRDSTGMLCLEVTLEVRLNDKAVCVLN